MDFVVPRFGKFVEKEKLMCMYSREQSSRHIVDGDVAVIGYIQDGLHGSGSNKYAVPIRSEAGITCLCIPDGAKLLLQALPDAFVAEHGLESNEAVVIFREGKKRLASVPTTVVDRFEFPNGKTVNFQLMPTGVGLRLYVAKPVEPPVELVPSSDYEGELVGAAVLSAGRFNPHQFGSAFGIVAMGVLAFVTHNL